MLRLYLTGDRSQRADIHPHGQFFGTIYGPNAVIDLGTDFELFGAVAGRRVELQPHMRFHFDEMLVDMEDETEVESVLYWGPTGMTGIPRLADRRDPFTVLGLEADELSCAADLWDGAYDHGEDQEEDQEEDNGTADDGSSGSRQ